MRRFILSLLLNLSVCYALKSLWYPPLYWHKDDCRFQTVRKNGASELFVKVIHSDFQHANTYGWTLLCPTITMNNWMPDKPDDTLFYENVWQVDKDGFDKCRVNTTGDPKVNRLIMLCNNKMQVKRHFFYFIHMDGLYHYFKPYFEKGKHYYFISTSTGDDLTLNRTNNMEKETHCRKYTMKLHIYVCDHLKEDCIYELPKCGPPRDLYRDMQLINGKLPAVPPTHDLLTVEKIITPQKTMNKKIEQVAQTATTQQNVVEKPESTLKPCKKEDEGTSIHLILNFVLGGVALFMAVVIIILVCGLSNRRVKSYYDMDRPPSAISTTHGGHIVNAEIINAEMVRYSDGHVQLSPVILSRTPPTSPSVIVPPYPTLQRIHSSRQNTSDYHPVEDIPIGGFTVEDTPQERSPLESPSSNEAFTFPDHVKAVDSDSQSNGPEISDSITTDAIVTNPLHDQKADT